jgi:CubicO group peptidase (beta-lactamase class C family)
LKKALVVTGLLIILGVGGFVAGTWPWTKLVVNAKLRTSPSGPDELAEGGLLERVAGGPYRPLPRPSVDDPVPDFSVAEAINLKYDAYSLMIWHKGKVLLEKYYNGATADSRSEAASMHKSVVSILMGIAIAEGFIGSVDDPLAKYIPEWKDDNRGKITIRNVLNMATGLAPLSKKGGVLSANSRFAMGLSSRSLALSRTARVEPGTVFEYGNPNAQLAGIVIEGATKRRYPDYLSEKIWRPLAAGDAYVRPFQTGGMTRTYAGLLARPEDWLRVGILLKDGGMFEGKRIVPSAWVEQMIAPSATNPNYGMLVWRASPYVKHRYYGPIEEGDGAVASNAWLAPDIFFFDGYGGRRVYVSRAEDLVIVRFGKSRLDWDDSALPNAVIEALHKAKQGVPLIPERR